MANAVSRSRFKLTKEERSWILYDIGNSAFILLVSTLMPIFFDYLAESEGLSSVDYLAYWGYAASAATLIVALSGPILGAVADNKNYKKPLFLAMILIGTLGCATLGFLKHWLAFLVVFVIAKVGYSSSLIFYDAMLTDVSTPDRMDEVSSQGYAWGYIGSCIPFGIGLVIVLGAEWFGLTMELAMTITFCLIALWWLLVSIPLLKNYRQKYYVARQNRVVKNSFLRIVKTLKNARKEKHIFLFLLAFFFYIDGVYTIIDMATAYGQALGFDSTGLLIALLVTQFVAFPASIIFGRLAKKFSPRCLILICIAAYTGIAVFALFMNMQIHFWILAVCVGMFQGGIQALSRSYFAKIIPAEQAGEYFGLLDICGKGAVFIGTALVGVVSQLTGSINLGVGALVLLFAAGMVLFWKASSLPGKAASSSLPE